MINYLEREGKVCPHCGVHKLRDDYTVAKRRVDRMSSWCKECFSNYRKEWNQRPAVKQRNNSRAAQAYRDLSPEEKHRRIVDGKGPQTERRLLKLYGLTLNDYDLLLEKQNGGCGLCGSRPKRNRLAVDHDHSCCPGAVTCGKCIRGLLCTPCNIALGMIENPKWINAANDWLEHR